MAQNEQTHDSVSIDENSRFIVELMKNPEIVNRVLAEAKPIFDPKITDNLEKLKLLLHPVNRKALHQLILNAVSQTISEKQALKKENSILRVQVEAFQEMTQ